MQREATDLLFRQLPGRNKESHERLHSVKVSDLVEI
jgi:hypothetical protein